MHFPTSTSISVALLVLTAGLSVAAPTKRQSPPLTPQVIATAGGGIPDAGLPPTLSPATLNDLQVALFVENIESFFFQSGAQNISTWGTAGFPDNTLDVIQRVAAQEEVHVSTFEAVLAHYNSTLIPACTYQFPTVHDTSSFLRLAQIITSVGIGAVIDITSGIAGLDPLLVDNLASTVTVEARHDAFFRQAALGLVPNPTPQDTRISAVWALNLALPFVVPGSCPLTPQVPLFPPMPVRSPVAESVTGSAGNIVFAIDVTNGAIAAATAASEPLFVAWVNQANVPVYVPVTIVDGSITTVIPPGMGGMAFAALTGQNQAVDVAGLTAATLAGPTPVQIS